MIRYFQVRFGGCNHSSFLTEAQLRSSAKGERLNPEKGVKEDLYMCPACMNGEPGCSSINGQDDGRSVLRSVASVRRLSPLEVFQIDAIERAGG